MLVNKLLTNLYFFCVLNIQPRGRAYAYIYESDITLIDA